MSAGSVRPVLFLVIWLVSCTPAKETGITMERVVAGDYQMVAKCVNRVMMRQATADYIPQMVDFEDEKAAELWSVNVGGLLGAGSKLEEQRIQQEGDQVRMITYLPSTYLGAQQMRNQVGGYWDKCIGRPVTSPSP